MLKQVFTCSFEVKHARRGHLFVGWFQLYNFSDLFVDFSSDKAQQIAMPRLYEALFCNSTDTFCSGDWCALLFYISSFMCLTDEFKGEWNQSQTGVVFVDLLCHLMISIKLHCILYYKFLPHLAALTWLWESQFWRVLILQISSINWYLQ